MSNQILSDYFLEKLNNLNDLKKYQFNPNIIKYLTQLLTDSSNCDFLFKNNESKYLFDLYKKSIESSGKLERSNNFKHLGDYSLITAGYFADIFDQKFNIDYYIEMGSSAYYQVYFISSQKFFQDLSNKYQDCIFILNDLASLDRNNSESILKLYTSWQKTQNNFTKKKLLNLGMITEEVKE